MDNNANKSKSMMTTIVVVVVLIVLGWLIWAWIADDNETEVDNGLGNQQNTEVLDNNDQ